MLRRKAGFVAASVGLLAFDAFLLSVAEATLLA